MLIKVLGSAAGGGFPQWNCNGPISRLGWDGDPSVRRRTQSSLAVSADGVRWVLLNASPDVREQIGATPALQPVRDAPRRNSPIRSVVLTNADVDHIAGLLSLREGHSFTIHATHRVLAILASNSIFDVLAPERVPRKTMHLLSPQPLMDQGQDLGLSVEAFAVPGKVALYLERGDKGARLAAASEDTIGLKISDRAGAEFFYVPACGEIDAALAERLSGAALVFFDGTLYEDDELIAQGLLDKTGRRMGHISMRGAGGSLENFALLGVGRKVYIHINNSNPVLSTATTAYRTVCEAGWEVGFDGMEIEL